MLPHFPNVSAFVEADDVVQQTAVRLFKSLEEVTPATARDFFGFAAAQMRRELIDLARRWAGRPRPGNSPVEDSAPVGEASDSTFDPAVLSRWTEFHEAAGRLPAEEREVFQLLWYHGLPTAEAAGLLGVSPRTVHRRWASARLMLLDAVGQLPL